MDCVECTSLLRQIKPARKKLDGEVDVLGGVPGQFFSVAIYFFRWLES